MNNFYKSKWHQKFQKGAIAKLQPRIVSVSPILEQRQKELLQIIPSWEKIPAIFAENFFDDYLMDELKAEAKALFEQVGTIKTIGKMIAENQLRGYCILVGAIKKLKLSFLYSFFFTFSSLRAGKHN